MAKQVVWSLRAQSDRKEILDYWRLRNKSNTSAETLASAGELYENGGYSDPFGIMVEGYMAWERVADLLPLDYRSKSFGN